MSCKNNDDFNVMKTLQKKPVILIVDDDENILYALREVLMNDGFSFLEAKDGMQAVEKIKVHQPNILIMDVDMPNMNGLDAVKQIRKFNPVVKIIIMTANGLDGYKQKFSDLMIHDYLSKPLSVNSIRSILRT